MKTTCIAMTRALLFPTSGGGGEDEARSGHERFAIPFTFKPQLSFPKAVVATVAAFLRILLGSLLFAVWGAVFYSRCCNTCLTRPRTNKRGEQTSDPLHLSFFLPATRQQRGIQGGI